MSAAVGIGFNSQADAATIARAVRLALARGGLARASLHTSARKRDSEDLKAAARDLDLPLTFHDETDLQRFEVVSHSPRVQTLAGVGSLAEAAALAGAGAGARLLVTKFSLDGVSCALAIGPEDQV